MRPMWLSLSLAVLLITVGLAPSPPAAVAAPKQDSVVGSGEVPREHGERFRFEVAAHSGPTGENPRGVINMWWEDADVRAKGLAEVTCVAVEGNRATVWGKFRKPIPVFHTPGSTYQIMAVTVVDGGSGKENDRLTGLIGSSPTEFPPVRTCTPQEDITFIPFSGRGNFTVRDAEP
jgi:hypothetical protein